MTVAETAESSAAHLTTKPGSGLFSQASMRVVAELNRRHVDMTWSVSRVDHGHQVHLHVAGDIFAAGTTVEWDDTLCKRMLAGGAHIVPDTMADSNYADSALVEHIRGYAGMPITNPDGETFGVLCGLRRDPLPGDLDVDVEMLGLLGGLLSDLLATARLVDASASKEQSALIQAQTDHLTGLTNRRGWDLALRQAELAVSSYGDHVTVVVMDIDRLKHVNDTEGHAVGDDMLRDAARVLRELVRRDDVVARVGGDEFAILFIGLGDDEATARLGQLRAELDNAEVAASLGMATATQAIELMSLVSAADQRMYVDKRQRRAARVSPEPSGGGRVG
ncbi:MAG: GGDEF domain-containing protein [Propionibacteriales bacterium]|nr:GGDEF domain-containing protein [Propionibacteriales bacterium]